MAKYFGIFLLLSIKWTIFAVKNSIGMKNIVIAAGYATRLGELTKNFPKPLLKIGENTILGRMLDDIDRIPGQYHPRADAR